MSERDRKRVRKKNYKNAYTFLYVMDTIVLYVTPYTESVFIYVSPNTMQNLARCSLEECCPMIDIEERKKRGTSERARERNEKKRRVNYIEIEMDYVDVYKE